MFISRKKLEKIIEEERYKEREKIWQEYDRQERREYIDKKFCELETRIWELSREIEKEKRKQIKR